MTIPVLVADDQDIVRAGLCMILGARPDITVVGGAADGRRAIARARSLRPDVCLLDIRMPDVDGIEATRQVAGPGVADPLAVVVITTFDLDEYVYGALQAGARGFLLKDAGAALLTRAVHAAARGDALIAPNITVRLLAPLAGSRSRAVPPEPVEPLTAREEEVLLAAARGRDQRRDRRRAVHQPQHRHDPHRRPDARARRPQPRGGPHVGLRDAPRRHLIASRGRPAGPPPRARRLPNRDHGGVSFTHDATIPADPATVLATLTEEAFVREALAELGADVREVTVAGTRTTARYSVPTQGIPQAFARFVGDRVEVTDVRTWTAEGEGASGTVVVTTSLFGRDVRLDGHRRLEPSPEGSRISSTGHSSVDAPIVGRQAEKGVDELAGVVLRREAEALTRRLGA